MGRQIWPRVHPGVVETGSQQGGNGSAHGRRGGQGTTVKWQVASGKWQVASGKWEVGRASSTQPSRLAGLWRSAGHTCTAAPRVFVFKLPPTTITHQRGGWAHDAR